MQEVLEEEVQRVQADGVALELGATPGSFI
jgi:hypothetical protein